MANEVVINDGYGNLIGTTGNPWVISTATNNFNNASVGATGSTIPTSATLFGASDGTNLQQLLVESSSNRNLRISIFQGTTEVSVTASNALKVDGSAVTQPVSGTITANAGSGTFTVSGTITANQGGTWTVQPGNTANTTPWLVTDSSDGTVAAGTAASKSSLIGVIYNTLLPTLTNGQQAAAQADSNGRLLIGSIASALPAGANTIGAVTQASGPWTQNITQFGSANISTGTGASGAGIPRVTVSNDSNILATQSGTWTVQPGNTANTTAWFVKDNSLGTVAAGTAGTQSSLAGLVYNTALPALTNGQQAAAQADSSGRLIIAPLTNTSIVKAQLQDNSGNAINSTGNALNVNVVSSSTGVYADKTAFTYGTTNEGVIGGVYQDTSPTLTAGTSGAIRVTSYRAVHVNLRDSSGNEVITSSGSGAGNGLQCLVGQYNSSLPTLTTGSVTYIQTDVNGRVITAPAGTNASSAGFALGTVITSSKTNTALRASTYTEQSSDAQRSIKSSNASDINISGTGARQVKITYLDSSGNGPYTETVNLNGTTAVNTVNTNICYIESLNVITVGSDGSNVGIITLYTTTGGGGSAIGSINAGDNETFWAHHYVPTGKTTHITGLSGNNTNSSNGSILTITGQLLNSNSPEFIISDYYRVGGGTAQTNRTYGTPIQFTGPARVTMYSACEGTATITTRGSFDYYDQ